MRQPHPTVVDPRRSRSRWRATLLLCAGLAAPTFAASLDELRALVEGGRSNEAYATYCGIATEGSARPPQFDLWCGVAAVDIGRPGEGTLALERYVLQFPNDVRGHLELARAYYYVGDDVRAREEFELVQRQNPPAEVVIAIDRYLDAIATRESRYQTKTWGYLEAGGGYDSNANAGVAQSVVGLPVLGDVTVNGYDVRKASPFGWLAGVAGIKHPIAPGYTLNADVGADGTYYSNASQFDLGRFGVSLGGTYQSENNLYTLSYGHGEITLDGSRFRWTDGVGLEWRQQAGERTSFALVPQYARINYSDANSARDADLTALSGNFRQVWLSTWQPVLNVNVFYGDEHNREQRDDLGRTLWGGGADVTVSPSPFWAINAGVGYTQSNYAGPIPLLDVTRHDHELTANLAALYLFTAHWSIRAEYQYARNNSNISLYEYSRQVGAIKLRYEFK
jgi:hypothetical protein